MKPLIETNPYMRDSKVRNKLIDRTVITSTGVEGVKLPKKYSNLARNILNKASERATSNKVLNNKFKKTLDEH